jgi:hypothetical protein
LKFGTAEASLAVFGKKRHIRWLSTFLVAMLHPFFSRKTFGKMEDIVGTWRKI